MLIDALTFALEKSGCLDNFWGKLDAGSDATLAVAASARRFWPQPASPTGPRPRW